MLENSTNLWEFNIVEGDAYDVMLDEPMVDPRKMVNQIMLEPEISEYEPKIKAKSKV
jgi:hypothetical protein